MTEKKYVSYEKLCDYDTLIKDKIATDDSAILTNSKSYTDSKVSDLTNGNVTVAKANSATKLGSITIGSDSQPVYLNSGVATKVNAVGIAYGGTGATTVADARTNLDVYSKLEVDTLLEDGLDVVEILSLANKAAIEANISALETMKTDIDALAMRIKLNEDDLANFVPVSSQEINNLF